MTQHLKRSMLLGACILLGAVSWSLARFPACSCQDSTAPDHDDDHVFRRTIMRSSFEDLTDGQWGIAKDFLDKSIDEAVGQISSDFGKDTAREMAGRWGIARHSNDATIAVASCCVRRCHACPPFLGGRRTATATARGATIARGTTARRCELGKRRRQSVEEDTAFGDSRGRFACGGVLFLAGLSSFSCSAGRRGRQQQQAGRAAGRPARPALVCPASRGVGGLAGCFQPFSMPIDPIDA